MVKGSTHGALGRESPPAISDLTIDRQDPILELALDVTQPSLESRRGRGIATTDGLGTASNLAGDEDAQVQEIGVPANHAATRRFLGAGLQTLRRLNQTAMYVIHRHVRRTQLYLDEECARMLTAESRRRGTTISALVREAVDRAYGSGSTRDRTVIIDRLAGVWSDRADLRNPDRVVRVLRESKRPGRWGDSGGGQVPARQRRRHRMAPA